MDREYLKQYRIVGGLLLFIGVFTNVLTIFSAPIFTIFGIVFSEDVDNIQSLLMALNTFVAIYTYYLAYRIFIKKYDKQLIRINKIKKQDILPCILASVLGFIIIRLSWKLVYGLLNTTKLMDYDFEAPKGIFAIIYVVILGPIAEEIVFRGWCIDRLKKYGSIPAIVFTSLAFGLFHGNLFQCLAAIIIGIVFAYLTIRFNSILPSIILHILNNALAFYPSLISDTSYFNIYLIISILAIILTILTNIIKHKHLVPGLKMTLKLSYHSISYIVFCIFFIILITLHFIYI